MHAPRYSDLAVATKADALLALLSRGYLQVYDGARPDDAGTPVEDQVLLAELRFGKRAFTKYVNGAAVLEDPLVRSSRQEGPFDFTRRRATWFRALTRDEEPVFDGTVGLSGCDMNVEDVVVTLADDVTVTSFYYVEPKRRGE